jgi:methyl-accepting chemotaxis protein
MPLAWKTAVVALVVLVPLLFVLPPYLSVQNSTVGFARQEIVGLRYAVPLGRLIDSSVLASYDAQRGAALPAALPAEVKAVATTDSQTGSQLQTSKLWSTASADLTRAEDEADAPRPAVYRAWATAVNDLVNLMAQVGSGSNMTLDPDLATYFQGDILISRAPLFEQNAALVANIGLSGDKNLVVDRALAQGAAQSALATASADLAATKLSPGYLRPLEGLAAQLGAAGAVPAQVAIADRLNQAISSSLGSLLNSRVSANQATNDRVILETVLGLLLAAWLVAGQMRQVKRSTRRLVTTMEGMAGGDLSVRAQVEGRDEFARIASCSNEALGKLQGALSAIGQSVVTLSSSSGELASVGQQMSGTAKETAAKAATVSATGEVLSNNVNSVAAAVEQMSASIREIAGNAGRAAEVASRAAGMAIAAGETVDKLSTSSGEIGEVVSLITAVAAQTNLLALNATIEAARAGEAGRGFAIVAAEVKELAHETTKATDQISKRIGAIQADTRSAVESISQVRATIAEIDEIQASIAAAVEEQSAATSEIGRNASEASAGVSEIAANIVDVARSATDTSAGVGHNLEAAAALADLASDLGRLVGQFR